MTTDAEVACPDPNCSTRLRITRTGRRRFSHAATTAVPLPGGLRPMQRIRLAPDHEISRVIRGGWQMAGGHGAVDARGRGRGHGRLRRRRDHHLRLRRHLYRRRGADRRLPRALPRAPRRGGAGADQGAHQVRAGPRPPAAADPRRRGRHRRPLAEAARDRAARPRAAALVGLRRPRLARGGAVARRAPPRRQDRPHRRHQLRHRAHGRDHRRRGAARLDAGAVFAARPPPGEGDARRRRRARGVAPLLRHGGRRLPRRPLARAGRAGGAAREPLAHQVQAHHRRHRRLGPLPGAARGAARRRRPPRQRHRHGGERARSSPGRASRR